MSSSEVLENLANTTTNFAIAAIMLAVLTAIFMQAAYEIGLRAYLQRTWVNNWIEQRLTYPTKKLWTSILLKRIRRLFFGSPKSKEVESQWDIETILTQLEGKGRESSIYSLNYQQLCGQIASSIQGEIVKPRTPELLKVFALGMDPDDLEKLGSSKA